MAGATESEPLLHVVLYQPDIPQNAGNIGRSCVAVGAKLWFVRPLGFRLDDRYLRRAGMDYWEQVDWEAVDDWDALLERLPTANRWFFTKTATRPYTSVEYQRGDVMVFGSEAQGLPAELLAREPDRALRIPVRPSVRRLNLSNAVAVAAYEALRQHQGDHIE